MKQPNPCPNCNTTSRPPPLASACPYCRGKRYLKTTASTVQAASLALSQMRAEPDPARRCNLARIARALDLISQRLRRAESAVHHRKHQGEPRT